MPSTWGLPLSNPWDEGLAIDADRDEIQAIRQRRRIIVVDPAFPGFKRFYPTTPNFPISVCFPSKYQFFFHFSDLYIEFTGPDGDSFGVTKNAFPPTSHDLLQVMRQEFDERLRAARMREFNRYNVIVHYKIKDRERDAVTVGQGRYAFRAPSVIYRRRRSDLTAQSVVFADPGGDAYWDIDQGGCSALVYSTVLASFRMLSSEFFSAMPMSLSDQRQG